MRQLDAPRQGNNSANFLAMHAFNTLVILIPQSREKNPCSRKVDKQLPRFFAESTLSQLRRFFSRDCGIRMTGEGLRMTGRGNA
jgi:hypothetical protein